MSRAVAATLRKMADQHEDFRILRYKLLHMIENATALQQGEMGIRFFTALQGSMAS